MKFRQEKAACKEKFIMSRGKYILHTVFHWGTREYPTVYAMGKKSDGDRFVSCHPTFSGECGWITTPGNTV